MEKCKENGIEIDCECGKLNPPLPEEKKLKCLKRNGEDCEEDIYGNCYHCGRYMLSVENDLVDWEKELTEQIDKNPDFVFYDFDGGLGKDLISFISNLLSSNTERVKKDLFRKIKDYNFKENHLCRFNDGECDCECFIQGLNVALNYINSVK